MAMAFEDYVTKLKEYLEKNDKELCDRITEMFEKNNPDIAWILDYAYGYSKWFGFEKSVDLIRKCLKRGGKK